MIFTVDKTTISSSQWWFYVIFTVCRIGQQILGMLYRILKVKMGRTDENLLPYEFGNEGFICIVMKIE